MFTAIGLGVAGVAGAVIGSDASKSAANAQVGASTRATDAATGMYQQTRQDLLPYSTSGTTALQQLMYMTGLGPKPAAAGGGQPTLDDKTGTLTSDNKVFSGGSNAYLGRFGYGDPGGGSLQEIAPTWGVDRVVDSKGNIVWGKAYNQDPNAAPDPAAGSLTKPFDYSLANFYQDPSYNFVQSQGEQALNRGAAAAGLEGSTPGLKSLMRFNQDLASTQYSTAFNRAFSVDQANKSTTFNFLSGIAGLGQNAAAQTGNVGVATTNTAANATMAGGAATAAGITGSAAAINNNLQGGLANYMYTQRYNNTMGMYGSLLNQQRAPAAAPTSVYQGAE